MYAAGSQLWLPVIIWEDNGVSPTTGQTLKTDKAFNRSEPKYLQI